MRAGLALLALLVLLAGCNQPSAGSGVRVAVPAGSAGQVAAAGDAMAQQLRANVVSIHAVWRDQTSHDGFGFVVAITEDGAWIITANHILRGLGPEERAATVTVQYFDLQGRELQAELLGSSSDQLDLAVLRAPGGPAGWQTDALGTETPSRGLDVWFIGRGGRWDVPARSGAISEVSSINRRLIVDGLSVQVGTSGAPLVSSSGIIGLVLTDQPGGVVEAVPVDAIQNAFREWNYPWRLRPSGPSSLVASNANRDGARATASSPPTESDLGVPSRPAGRVDLEPPPPPPAPGPDDGALEASSRLPLERGYRLGINDSITVAVFNHADLSGEYTLDDQGKFAMPLIGTVAAGGMTPRELEDRIEDALRGGFLVDPRVTVEVVQVNADVGGAPLYYLVGEVRNPAAYPLVTGITVRDAIGRAGGFTPRARQDEILLQRSGSSSPSARVDGGTSLEPGDIITVQERHF